MRQNSKPNDLNYVPSVIILINIESRVSRKKSGLEGMSFVFD